MPSDVDIPLIDHKRLVWETDKASLLGEGSFGIVYRGAWNGTPVAIKVVKPTRSEQSGGEKVSEAQSAALRQHRREIHRLSAVQNPYIIQYLGVFRDRQSRDLYIVTEFLEGGSLHDSLCKMRARDASLDERSFLQIALQMAYGLNHVHSENYTHGDMKPQNILLSASITTELGDDGVVLAEFASSAKVKIADFGLSKRLDGAEPVVFNDSVVATTDFGTGPCGTFLYMSPEAYMGVSKLSDADAKAADIYAYGLILFELLSGLQSWNLERVRNPIQLHLLVREGSRPAWGDRLSSLNPKYVRLVKHCWSPIAGDRPTAEEIVRELEELERQYSDVRETTHEMAPKVHVDVSDSAKVEDKYSTRVNPSTGVKEALGPQRQSPSIESTSKSDEDLADADDPQAKSGADLLVQSSDEIDSPTIVPVASMRRLTQSQVIEVLETTDDATTTDSNASIFHFQSLGASQGVSVDNFEQGGIINTEALERRMAALEAPSGNVESIEKESSTKISVAEIDESVVGGVQVMRVQSVPIRIPEVEPLQVPQDAEERATMGTGSIAGNLELPSPRNRRTGAELLESFVVAGAGLRQDENSLVNSVLAPQERVGEGGSIRLHGKDTFSQGTATNHRTNLAQHLDMHGNPLQQTGAAFVQKSRRSHRYIADNSNMNVPHPSAQMGSLLSFQQRPMTRPSVGDAFELSPTGYTNHSRPPVSDVPYPVTAANWGMQSHSRLTSNVMRFPPRPQRPGVFTSPQGASSPGCFQNFQGEGSASHLHGDKAVGPMSKYRPHGTMTGHGATAPLLSDTANGGVVIPVGTPVSHSSRKPGVPTWASLGREYGPLDNRKEGMGSISNTNASGCNVDMSEVLHALETSDASKHLRSLWSRGCMRAVAAGLAQTRSLQGDEVLDLVCDFLTLCAQWPSNRREPAIEKDLCTAMGNITRNECAGVRDDTVLAALRVVVSTMFAYRPGFQQNKPCSVEVYTSCHFALCNLLKASNVIKDATLRSELASWILHAMSWNLYDDGTSRGPHVDVLSYAATSAARNFMWMNEDNVAAFASGTRAAEAQPVSCLISSMKHFNWTRSLPVLEACLSALAIAINSPQQREAFMALHGAALVMDVLERHRSSTQITKLGFSMIAVLIPLSSRNHDESSKLERWLMTDNVCRRIVTVMRRLQQNVEREKVTLSALEIGYRTMLSCAKFSNELCAKLVHDGAATIVISMVQWLSSIEEFRSQRGEENSSIIIKLGASLCGLVQEFSNVDKTGSDFRKEVIVYLKMMLAKSGEDYLSGCLLATLETLSLHLAREQ